MSAATYEPNHDGLPSKGEVWKHRDNGRHYAFVARFTHDPKTCAPIEYVICQIYGNYGNEAEIIRAEAWPHLFDFAWGPLIECRFCGFRRMTVCTTRQTCPNLRDYRLEDDIAIAKQEPTDA